MKYFAIIILMPIMLVSSILLAKKPVKPEVFKVMVKCNGFKKAKNLYEASVTFRGKHFTYTAVECHPPMTKVKGISREKDAMVLWLNDDLFVSSPGQNMYYHSVGGEGGPQLASDKQNTAMARKFYRCGQCSAPVTELYLQKK